MLREQEPPKDSPTNEGKQEIDSDKANQLDGKQEPKFEKPLKSSQPNTPVVQTPHVEEG